MTANGPVTWAAVSALTERVAVLEEKARGSAARGSRTTTIVLAVITAVVAPLVVTSLIAWLHLRTH